MDAGVLARIDEMLTNPQAELPATADFRRASPGLSLTHCDDSDLGGEPAFREYPRFKLYLVDRTNHCWQLTQDLSRATGLVVTRNGVHA